jgi:hypothetical protein
MYKLPQIKMKRLIYGSLTLVLLAAPVIISSSRTAKAAAMTTSVNSLVMTGTGISLNTTTFEVSSAASAAITPTIKWTTSTALTTDAQKVVIDLKGIVVSSTLAATDLTLTGCSANTLEASPGTNNASGHEVSFTGNTVSSNNVTITITLDTTTGTLSCPAGNYTLAIAASKLTSHATPNNYQNTITTTQPTGTTVDNGAFLYYVGSQNQVGVTASIAETLSFVIRDSTDTGDYSLTCALGSLTTASNPTCAYRLKTTTNAANGYTVRYRSTQGFSNGTYSITDAAVTGTGTVIGAGGTEMYGASMDPGNTTTAGSTVTRGTVFGGGSGTTSGFYKITDTAGQTVYSMNKSNGPASTDTTNTALMTHKVTIDGDVPAGNYSHTVIYNVTAAF